MPAYLTVPGEGVAPPPYRHTGALMHALWFPTDRGRLQAILDTTLNRVPGFTFAPAAAGVMLIALHVDAVTSTAPTHADRGSAPETDIGWWMLTTGGRTGDAPKLRWFPIYLWVDSHAALMVGREVYGYPKFLGQAERASPDPDDARLLLRTDHFAAFAPTARLLRNAPLFSIDRTGSGSDSVAPALLNTALAAGLGLAASALGAGVVAPYAGMPMLFLRQLRAVEGGTDAAFQSIAAARVTPDAVRSLAWLHGQHILTVHPSASTPLAADLGLATGHKASFAFRIEQDFTAGPGKTL